MRHRCPRKAFATNSPANGSFLASSSGAEPMIVSSSTPRPSSQHADSQATTPPPMTAIRRGISCMLVTSREVHGSASRSPGMSGTVAVVPVASTTACRAMQGAHPAVRRRSPRRPSRRPAGRARGRHRSRCRAPTVTWLESSWSLVNESRRLQHGGDVDAVVADDALHTGHVPGGLEDLDRPQQRLARHAGPVRAFAAEQFVLDDHRGAVAALDGVLRDDLAGRPTADHDDVVGVALTLKPPVSDMPVTVARRGAGGPVRVRSAAAALLVAAPIAPIEAHRSGRQS